MTQDIPEPASSDNPAGRVLGIFEQLNTWRTKPNERLAPALARAFEDDVDSRRFMRKCIDLRDQAYEVQDLMAPLLPDLLGSEHSFAEFDTVLAAANMVQRCHQYSLEQFVKAISQQGWYALRFANTVLSKRATEPVMDTRQVQDYIKKIRKLIDEVQNDDQITVDDRSYLVGLLMDVETALREIRITGTTRVRSAVNTAVGALATDPVRRQTWAHRPFVKSLGTVLIGLATLVAAYPGGKEIALDAGWLSPPAITSKADEPREVIEGVLIADETGPTR